MKNTTEEKREAIPNSVSRMLLAGIGVLLQVLWIFWLALKLNDYSTAIQVCTSVLTFLITLRIYGLHINSAYKISWIILILLFPIFGLTIYLLFGRSGAVSVMRRRFGANMTMLRQYHAPILQQRRALPYPDRITRNHARYLQDRAGYPAYDNTDVTFYGDTCEALEAQKTALRSAEKFIFMEYHAIEDASAWQELEDILAERAAHGVEVRVFYDDVGSIGFINSKFVKKLAGRGIQCRRVNPVIPILNVFMNNRDHRKITVVDGRVGFTGGVNLADEYANLVSVYGVWKDTAVRLEGEAVRSLTLMFLQMWGMDEREPDTDSYGRYLNVPLRPLPGAGGYVLPYADSPLDDERVGECVYLDILNHAERYVRIMTPYLILDETMVMALTFAAKRGVDVELILPHVPDKKFAFALAKGHYRELLDAGVKIYEYTPGFVHAKVFVSDDRKAVVGTINLDYRSLYLHFEDAVYLYDCPCIKDIVADFDATRAQSQIVTHGDLARIPLHTRIAAALLKLVAPLM